MADAALKVVADDVEDIDALQAEADAEANAALDDNATAAPNPEAEKVARLMGWKPLDEWKGDSSNWKPASDFVAELPEVLKRTRKSNERLQEDFAKVVAQVAKLDANQRTELDAKLETDYIAAWDAGDFDKANAILQKKIELARAAPSEPAEPAAFTSFKARNTWFGVDDEATAYAATLDGMIAQRNGGKITDPDAHMRKVEEGVKKRFPELFVDPKAEPRTKPAAPLVNRGGRVDSRRPNGELTVADLTPAQRRAAAETNVTEAAYVKALNKINAKDRS